MRQPFRLARFLPVLTVLGLWVGAIPAHAQLMPRLLENIQVLEAGGRESVEFRFSSPYQGVPLEEHGRGRFSLGFSGTGSRVPVRNFRATGSKVIKDIRVVQNKYSTTVSLTLKDPSASLKGRLAFINDKELLRVFIGGRGTRPAAGGGDPGGEQSLLSQMTKTIAGDTGRAPPAGTALPATGSGLAPAAAKAESSTLGKYEGADWWPTMLTLGLSLAAVIGGLYSVMFLYNRLVGPRMNRLGGSSFPIKQVASFHIGPKQRIVVLDINGELVACGVTPGQITFLTRLGGATAAGPHRPAPNRPRRPAPPAAAAAGGGGAAGSEPSAEGSTTAGSGPEEATTKETAAKQAEPAQKGPKTAEPRHQPDPVQQFAEALKEKVSSMKRIK